MITLYIIVDITSAWGIMNCTHLGTCGCWIFLRCWSCTNDGFLAEEPGQTPCSLAETEWFEVSCAGWSTVVDNKLNTISFRVYVQCSDVLTGLRTFAVSKMTQLIWFENIVLVLRGAEETKWLKIGFRMSWLIFCDKKALRWCTTSCPHSSGLPLGVSAHFVASYASESSDTSTAVSLLAEHPCHPKDSLQLELWGQHTHSWMWY